MAMSGPPLRLGPKFSRFAGPHAFSNFFSLGREFYGPPCAAANSRFDRLPTSSSGPALVLVKEAYSAPLLTPPFSPSSHSGGLGLEILHLARPNRPTLSRTFPLPFTPVFATRPP